MAFNIPWRIGANNRSLAYYGEPDTIGHNIDSNLKRFQIEQMANLGIQVVRFYAPHHRVSTERSLELVGNVLDMLSEFDMQAVVCLSDALSHSGHFFLGDSPFHSEDGGGHLNRRYWTERHYEHHYLPFVTAIVERFKHHNGVLIWELGNEQAIRPQDGSLEVAEASKHYLAYVRTATNTIRAIDKHAIIGTGLVDTRHVFHTDEPAQLTAFSKELHGIVDAVSVHVYEQDQHENARLKIDADVARDSQKLLYVGELGSNFHQQMKPRPTYYAEQIQLWRGRGAFMVMLWDFNATDMAIADDLGVSKHFSDFNPLVKVISDNKGSMTRFLRADVLGQSITEGTATSFIDAADASWTHFRVTATQLSVRETPSLNAARVQKDGQDFYLNNGNIVAIDKSSRTVAEGYVWWKNSCGWSAERALSGGTAFVEALMVNDPGTIETLC